MFFFDLKSVSLKNRKPQKDDWKHFDCLKQWEVAKSSFSLCFWLNLECLFLVLYHKRSVQRSHQIHWYELCGKIIQQKYVLFSFVFRISRSLLLWGVFWGEFLRNITKLLYTLLNLIFNISHMICDSYHMRYTLITILPVS